MPELKINSIIDDEYMTYLKNNVRHRDAKKSDVCDIAHMVFGLGEEVGEVTGIFKKITWTSGFDPENFDIQFLMGKWSTKLLDELGDVLWYYTQICLMFEITPAEAKILNTLKLCKRHGDEWPFTTVSMEDAIQLRMKVIDRIEASRSRA